MLRSSGDSLHAKVLPPITADSERIIVPDAEMLLEGDFSRLGDDLILVGPDGTTLKIIGYFSGDVAPTLVGPNGMFLDGRIVTTLAGPQYPGQYAQATGPDGAKAIGVVEVLEGTVTVTRANGVKVQLKVGDPIFLNDVIETSDGATIGITFADETVFNMSANSRMVISELIYNPAGDGNSMLLDVIKGSFSFVAGKIAPTGDMNINTPVATIAVRGTSGGAIEIETEAGFIYITRDPITGEIGHIEIKVDGIVVQSLDADTIDLAVRVDPTTGVATSRPQNSAESASVESATQAVHGTHAVQQARIATGEPVVPDSGGPGAPDDGGVQDLTPPPPPPPAPQPGDGNTNDTPQDQTPTDPITPQDQGNLTPETNVQDPIIEVVVETPTGPNVIDGDDTSQAILGTANADIIRGFGGDDVIDGGGGNDIVDGGDGSDTLTGGDGDDQVSGGPGNDTLIGGTGAGNDSYDGGPDNDTVAYTSANGVSVSLATGVATGVGIDTDILTGIENVIGSPGDDLIFGDTGTNVLIGGAGNDAIVGGGGTDVLSGGSGDDTLALSAPFAATDGMVFDGGSGTDALLVQNVAALDLTAANRIVINTEIINLNETSATALTISAQNIVDINPGASVLIVGSNADTVTLTPALTGGSNASWQRTAVGTTQNGVTFDTFEFTDGESTFATALIEQGLTVNGANFGPVAVADTPPAVVEGDTATARDGDTNPITGNVLANDTDVDTPAGDLRVTGISTDGGATFTSVNAINSAVPKDVEFLINTAVTGPQDAVQIAGLTNGGFVAVWSDFSAGADTGGDDPSGGAVRGQLFDVAGNPVGTEFLVNTTTANDQDEPSVAALANGGFVVAWEEANTSDPDPSGLAVRAQIYDPAGNEVGTEFLVNTTTSGNQFRPAAVGLQDVDLGDPSAPFFVIAFRHENDTINEVRAQVFSVDGSPLGGEILVDTADQPGIGLPAVTALTDGGFVVTWDDANETGPNDTDGLAVRGRLYDADGTPRGATFEINVANTTGDQDEPSVTALSNGGFVVTWADNSQGADTSGDDASGRAVRGQVFDSSGTAVGTEFLINTVTDGEQDFPSVVALDTGGFVVTWDDASQGSETGGDDASGLSVRAQLFDATGNPVGSEFLVNSTTGNHQLDPTVAALPGGNFIIAWVDNSVTGDDRSGSAIRGQLFTTATVIAGLFGVLTINADGSFSYTLDNTNPTVLALAQGESLTDTFTYQMSDGSLTSEEVLEFTIDGVGQTFDPTADTVFTGGADADFAMGDMDGELLIGNGGNDYLHGGAGNDIVLGNTGGDFLEGGEDDDILVGGAGDDQLVGDSGAGNDILHSGDGNDLLEGGAGDDVLLGLGGDDTLVGGFGDDILVGGSEIDHFIGGPGNDRLVGGIEGENTGPGIDANKPAGDFNIANYRDTSIAFDDTFVDDANDALVLPGHGFTTGDEVIYQSGGTAIGGLTPAATLFVIVLDGDTIRLADSLPNAGSGIAIPLTGTGSGPQTLLPQTGVTIDLTGGLGTGLSTASGAGIGTDQLVDIDAVFGTAFDDSFTADDSFVAEFNQFNEFRPGAGDDVVTGNGATRIGYSDAQNAVTVNIATGTAVSSFAGDLANIGTDTFSGVNSLRGSQFADTLTGSDVAAFEQFRGQAGSDLIDGAGGSNDQADYRNSPNGIVADLSGGAIGSGTVQDGWGSIDTLVNIERIRGSEFDDDITMDNGANRVDAQDGDDTVRGLGGNDDLRGGFGNDLLQGGAGNDLIVGDAGADNLQGNAGADIIRSGGTVTTFRDAVSTSGNFVIDVLNGGGGNDVLIGEAGLSTLIGGAGDDILRDERDNSVDTFNQTRASYAGATVDAPLNFLPGDVIDGSNENQITITAHGLSTGAAIRYVPGASPIGGLAAGQTVFAIVVDANTLQVASTQSNAFASTAINISAGGSGTQTFEPLGIAATLTGALGSGASRVVGNASVGTDTLIDIERVFGTDFDDVFIAEGSFQGHSGSFNEFEGRGGDDLIMGNGSTRIGYAGASDGVSVTFTSVGTGSATSLAGGDAAGIGTDLFTGVNSVRGSTFADELTGSSAGSESFRGLAGDDTIDGGAGGQDRADYFNSPNGIIADLSPGAVGSGTVQDGWGTTDTLINIERIRGSAFDDDITGDNGANQLLGEAGNDILRGGGGADQLFGGDGDDILIGGGGGDTLDGGTGRNFFRGGAGNDFFIGGTRGASGPSTSGAVGDVNIADYRLAAAGITVMLAGGLGSALSTVSGTTIGMDTLQDIEAVFGTEHADTFTVDASFVGQFGNFALIRPGAGNDVITDGAGITRIDYSDAGVGVAVNLATGIATAVDPAAEAALGDPAQRIGTDTFSGVNQVTGTAFSDVLTGSNIAGLESFRPGAGDDIVNAAGGNNDRIDYLDAPSGVLVDLTAGFALDGFGGTDSLSGIERVRGSHYDDVIIGNAGANRLEGRDGNDILRGGGGNDILQPQAGEDFIDGGAGTDTLDYSVDQFATNFNAEFGTSGVFVNFFAGVATDGYGQRDVFINVENATGSNFDDIFVSGSGNNVFDGRQGGDLVSFIGSPGGVNVDLGGNIASDDGFGSVDTLTNIEHVEGSSSADIIVGNGSANLLNGRGGDDLITGGSGDQLAGDAGDDILRALNSNFSLIDGGLDQDTLAWDSGLLDLTAIANANLESLESIDITGTGNNTATLNLQDVIDLSETVNLDFIDANSTENVVIAGDLGDVVNLATSAGGAWFSAGATTIGGESFAMFDFSTTGGVLASVAVDADVVTNLNTS